MAVFYNDFDPFCCGLLRKHVAAGDLPAGDVDGRNLKSISPADYGEYGAVHLCAGIGGFPLGLSWAGITDQYRILTAGWPCQPHSAAGHRLGAADDRELWPEILRAIRGYRPRWFLGENVRDIRTTDGGDYFGAILRDLAQSGYDAEWQIIPASAVGAPHIRERIWIVAYPQEQRSLLWDKWPQAQPTQGAGLPSRRLWSTGAVPSEYIRVAYGLSDRMDRVKSVGNALVPQIPEIIGRLILEVENAASNRSRSDHADRHSR